MKSTAAKSLPILLALVVLAASMAPVCSGSENCSMPCCRDKAQPVSHSMDMASGRSCCTHSADDFADYLSACRFGHTSPALLSGIERASGMTVAVGTGVFDHPIERPSQKPLIGFIDTRLRGAPLYLHLHTLLI